MKKVFCFVLCLLLLVPSALADTAPVKLTEDSPAYTWLYEKSMELAESFQKSLNSSFHFFLLLPSGASKEELEAELKLLQAQDYTEPVDVVLVYADRPLTDNATYDMIEWGFAENVLPSEKKAEAMEELYHSTANFLYLEASTAMIVISQSLAINKKLVCSEALDGPCFAVMQYGGLYAYLITFYPLDNGKVSVCGRVIPSRAADALNLPLE